MYFVGIWHIWRINELHEEKGRKWIGLGHSNWERRKQATQTFFPVAHFVGARPGRNRSPHVFLPLFFFLFPFFSSWAGPFISLLRGPAAYPPPLCLASGPALPTQPSFSLFHLLESCALHMTTFPPSLTSFFFLVLLRTWTALHLLLQGSSSSSTRTAGPFLPFSLSSFNFYHQYHQSISFGAVMEAIMWGQRMASSRGFNGGRSRAAKKKGRGV